MLVIRPVLASVFPNGFLCATVHAGGAFELLLSSTSSRMY